MRTRINFKHFIMTGSVVVVILLVGMLMGKSASATVKTDITIYPDQAGEKASTLVDVDCDGVQNTVSISYRSESENGYTEKVFMEVDGKQALELDVSKEMGYGATARLMNYNGKYFLMQLWAYSDNDYMGYNYLYGYDKGAGSFYQLVDFGNGIHRYGGLVTDFYEDGVRVSSSSQFLETGWLYWSSQYTWNGSKLEKVTGKEWIERSVMDSFTVNKKLSFYKQAGGKNVAFSLKKGDKVSLQAVKVTKDKVYVQVKYKKKTGWLRIGYDEMKKEPFKDVHKYLVG